MRCTDCQEQLSDYIDGALELGEQTNIERHLADCEPCRAMRDDLLQIVHFSHQLPLQSPACSLWSRIQQDIQGEPPPSFLSQLRSKWIRFNARALSLSIPQLATATALLVVLALAGTLALRRGAGGDAGQAAQVAANDSQSQDIVRLSSKDLRQIEDQINKLSESVERRKDSWDPEVRESFEKNLYYVDQSLVECRHQLSNNPADDVAQELMLNAYREKVRLLQGFEKF
jgi:anti-sigma-K factor RskA